MLQQTKSKYQQKQLQSPQKTLSEVARKHTLINNRQMPAQLIVIVQNSEVVASQPGLLLTVELKDPVLWKHADH